jgi:hypothetical protein
LGCGRIRLEASLLTMNLRRLFRTAKHVLFVLFLHDHAPKLLIVIWVESVSFCFVTRSTFRGEICDDLPMRILERARVVHTRLVRTPKSKFWEPRGAASTGFERHAQTVSWRGLDFLERHLRPLGLWGYFKRVSLAMICLNLRIFMHQGIKVHLFLFLRRLRPVRPMRPNLMRFLIANHLRIHS